ncbi:hypothetical protein DCAR_0208486 [Daucus carota subsp. sativus]|uniref:Uncharacterized protein n=1 Tax=Daucus carota subsp. sativus TaxID=79200 RepID=A0AAF1AN29_DAUCS|nr:hypothetical protein DCAR_0208486 [Daucus carota subsp. sativus]
MSQNEGGAAVPATKKRLQCKGLGKFVKQERARIYIIRTCVVTLLCWRD